MATLKEEHLKEREKQREIISLLGPVDNDRYAILVGLGKKITDYGTDKLAAMEGGITVTSCEGCDLCSLIWRSY